MLSLYSTAKRETGNCSDSTGRKKSLAKASALVGLSLFNLNHNSFQRYKNKTRRTNKWLIPIVAASDTELNQFSPRRNTELRRIFRYTPQ